MGYNRGNCKANLLSKESFREKTVENINKLITNEAFNCRSKDGLTGVFTRDRKLNFKNTLLFIARGVTSSLQRELDGFFKEVADSDFNVREVTKSAFSQARKKLKHNAFIELNDVVTNTFYNDAPYKVWKNMRLLAVDGTRLMLPNHPSTKEEFGQHSFGPKANSKRTMALASCLYDPLNLLSLDAQIASFASSERDLLYKHLDKTKQGDLILLDRGYPSLALIFLLRAKKLNFCMRMKANSWTCVKKFTESDKTNEIVEFSLPIKDREKLINHPEIINQKLKCRLTKVKLISGETEILCTSLMDQGEYTDDDLSELYHCRWSEEEGFKLLKARIEVENFSGKTATAVKQDFFAKIFLMSFSASLAFPIEQKVRKEYQKDNNKKYDQKINRTGAISNLRLLYVNLFIKKLVKKSISVYDDIVSQTREIIRPNRSQPRKHRIKSSYCMNYKRL